MHALVIVITQEKKANMKLPFVVEREVGGGGEIRGVK